MKYTCPCMGYKTLDEEPTDTYEICNICFWEDDGVQYRDPYYEGGANEISLRQAQQNFIKFGPCEAAEVLLPENGLISENRKSNFSVSFSEKLGFFTFQYSLRCKCGMLGVRL